ncbi:hypothetical protein [Paenibacillus sanguinis]|uniref:hypothetical protein n=1 Tax=Paenibacillus sanguinis TaxID=225906 RepID=UPI0003725CAC|nr:hypothetical protein [Paenibacillus sanguinis]
MIQITRKTGPVFFAVMFAQAVNNPVTEVTGPGSKDDYNIDNLRLLPSGRSDKSLEDQRLYSQSTWGLGDDHHPAAPMGAGRQGRQRLGPMLLYGVLLIPMVAGLPWIRPGAILIAPDCHDCEAVRDAGNFVLLTCSVYGLADLRLNVYNRNRLVQIRVRGYNSWRGRKKA